MPIRDRKASVHIVSRRVSCLSSFYKWAKRNEVATDDPVYQVEKPKRPRRIPVWLERHEQQALEAAVRNVDDIPATIFGQPRERMIQVRRRYEMLYLLILNAGLRITEALRLKVRDVKLQDGFAYSLRIIGKGDKERIVPLPEAFGQVFGFWLSGRPKDAFVFAQQPGPGGQPPSPQSARSYLRRLREKAGIDKPVTPHKLRHTYATRVLESGAQLVEVQALLGHDNIATTQMYTHVSEERMRAVVKKL
ncbi:MAG: tyrosine-type recombinase/integrase [Gammaproteobacteria bacterium]|nr:tyrosine-type recombinase/integrase [Gammaproteobacteria bacterium]MCP5458693.1 tyrosine-type recombinase/integrase [Gammaproteobacteria bacterium]